MVGRGNWEDGPLLGFYSLCPAESNDYAVGRLAVFLRPASSQETAAWYGHDPVVTDIGYFLIGGILFLLSAIVLSGRGRRIMILPNQVAKYSRKKFLLSLFYDLIRPLFVKDVDPNEDYNCIRCGWPVLRRQLFCSKACYKAELVEFGLKGDHDN